MDGNWSILPVHHTLLGIEPILWMMETGSQRIIAMIMRIKATMAMLVTCTPQAQTVKTVKVQEGEILHQVQSPSR